MKNIKSPAALIGSLLRPAGGHQRGPAAGVRRGGPRPGQACARAGGRADPRRWYQRGSGWDGVKRGLIFPILVAARWSGGAWVWGLGLRRWRGWSRYRALGPG